MIYVLKHSNGKYVKAAMCKLKYAQDGTYQGLKLVLVERIEEAQLIEDPDMQVVYKYKLEPILVSIEKPKLKIQGKIL